MERVLQLLCDWAFWARLYQASVLMLLQLCNDATDALLIENNGVA